MRRRALLGGLLALVGVSGASAQRPRVVRIEARRFAFRPGEVTLQAGVPVILEFTTADVVMGFSAPGLNLRADIVPGQVAQLAFTPQKTGAFEYLCDIFCGDGHEKMTGMIRVI